MKKRTNKKSKLKENLIEGLLELALAAVFFAIGWGVLSLFGINTEETDPDLTVLIGFAALAVIFGAVAVAVHFMKKKSSSHDGENDKKE